MATTAPGGGLIPGADTRRRRLAGKPVKTRKTSLIVHLYYAVMAVGSGSLRLWETLKGFQGFPVPARPGCWIAKAGQPLLLATCSSLFRSPRITAMTTSSTSAPSRPLSRSEWVSTLPPWRRLLAMLNWRPVYDIEQRTRQFELNALASERRMQESEKRLKLLQESNVRIARFEQELFSSSNQAHSTGDSSPT